MKSLTKISALSSLMLILSCAPQVEDIPCKDSCQPSEESFMDGTANIYLSEEMAEILESASESGMTVTKSSELNSAFEALGVTSFRRLFPHAGEFEPRTRKAGLHRWYKITYSNDIPATKAHEGLTGVSGIEKFSPEREISLRGVFNDPKLGLQWHYMNDGSISSEFTAGADINVVPVWETFTKGSRDVVVAVIDEGVDQNHEDLAGNYVGGKNFASGGKVTPGDHGCHVAGTIAAVNNNGKGGCGIAGGDLAAGIEGVGILACQIFSGNLPVGGAEAIKWAADNGAVIANNSWGYVHENEAAANNATISDELAEAIDYFIEFAGCDNEGNQLPTSPMKGGVVFFASGNDGWRYDPIGEYEPVISVGSIGPDYSKASYSNYGDWVDIAAPGGIYSINKGMVYSCVTENSYDYMQGTSMACPHVSGVAALIVSHFGGAGFTNEMLKERLFAGARYDVLSPVFKIGPLVDAMGAFTAGGTIPPDKVEDWNIDIVGNKVTVSFDVTADEDDIKTFGYMILMSEKESDLNAVDPKNLPEGVTVIRHKVGTAEAGENISVNIPELEFEKEYFMCIIGYDYSMNYSEPSPVKSVKTLSNNAPETELLQEMTGIRLKSHENISIGFIARDPEGGELTASLTGNTPGVSVQNTGGDMWKLNINANLAKAGTYSGEINLTDVHGLSTSFGFGYEIMANNAPVIIQEMEGIYLEKAGETFTFDLNEYFSDPDGEKLGYKLKEGNRMVAKATLTKNILEITISGYGATSLTVTASDAKNANCSMEVDVMVKNPDNLIEMYPVPVTDVLNIRTGAEKQTEIMVRTMSGQVIYQETLDVSAFTPAVIDMTGCAPGKYSVTVIIGEDKTERIITKI